jgi:thiamine biosynthesis lipoprotein
MNNLYVFGTLVNISFKGNDEIKEKITKLLYDIDDKCSLYKEDSDINKINNNSGKYVKVDKIVYDIIKKSIYYSTITGGDMDISARVVEKKDLKLINYKNIKLKEPDMVMINKDMRLDLGSIVKGYATDMIVDILKKNKIKDALINLGGNIYVMGKKNNNLWKVGIEDPFIKDSNPVGYLELTNKSVVTSGIVQRGDHIINPHTGERVNNNIRSITIISDKSIDAEGLSTAYFIKGLKGLKDLDMAIYIDNKKNIYLTDNLVNKFIILNKEYRIGDINEEI